MMFSPLLAILILMRSCGVTSAFHPTIAQQRQYPPRPEDSLFHGWSLPSDASFHGSSKASSHRYLIDGPTISSGACSNLRIDPFPVQLELFYYYRLDVVSGTIVDLSMVENAINQAVVGKLNDCDAQDRPLYALDLSPGHILLHDGNCTSLTNHLSNCLLVKASTFVLVDNGTQYVEVLAYDAIQSTLSNETLLYLVDPNIESAQFVGSEESRVVTLPARNNHQGVVSTARVALTTKVAFAVASVSSILTIIFAFGVYRRYLVAQKRQTQDALPQQRHPTTSPGLRVGIRRRGEYFDNLTDEEEPDRSVSPKFPNNANFVISPSELSDLTFDDSASMMSAVSRTTSKLERIDEEGEGPYDEEAAFGRRPHFDVCEYDAYPTFDIYGDGDTDAYQEHGLRRAEDCLVNVIEDYGPKRSSVFHGDDDKASELVGCKFLDDASLEGEPVPIHEVAPMEDWNASDDSIVPLEPFPVTVADEEDTEVVLCLPSYDFVETQGPQMISADDDDDDETDSTVNTDTSGENVPPLEGKVLENQSHPPLPICGDD